MNAQVWIWTVLAGIGITLQVCLVWDSVHRLRDLAMLEIEEADEADRRRVLVGHIRSGTCYWLVHAIFFYVGLKVIIGFDFGAVGYLFIFAAFLLIYAGLSDFTDRLYWRRRANARSRSHDERTTDVDATAS